jgi:hypothetical protein
MAYLTAAELMALWRSVVDDGYAQPFVDADAAGLGGNIEVFEQAAEQLSRASQMIETTTQGMYILPWSGQDNVPSAGANNASVTLTLSRTNLFENAVTITAGSILFEEVASDWGPLGTVDAITGRRFTLLNSFTFAPGEAGPFSVAAIAERPGYGYNQVEPGNIKQIVQIGSGLTNIRAAVAPGISLHLLIVAPNPDVVIPELVGQYIELVAGLNAGQVRRVIGYSPPVTTGLIPNGGTAVLAATGIFSSTITGTFIPGEEITQTVAGVITARGILLRSSLGRIVVDRLDGAFAVGATSTGSQSGATAAITIIDQSPDMFPEAYGVPVGATGATWRVLDWADDLGMVVTNAASPANGTSAMLDEWGDERKIYRQAGEVDTDYRKRVARVGDKISPNAIKRITNRILVPLGTNACLREVGLSKFRGMFFDGDSNIVDPTFAFAFDLDFIARPQDRFKLLLNYLEFRAFFLLGIPPVTTGDFGCFCDSGSTSFTDIAPLYSFFDGFNLNACELYITLWAAVDSARAAGVGFDFYIERYTCL